MKPQKLMAFTALFVALAFSGCGGGDSGTAGNSEAAKVIGVAPDSPEYGTASADMMSKMHGSDLPGAKKAEAKK